MAPCLLVIALAASVVEAERGNGPPAPRVRSEDRQLRELIKSGLTRSPTFKALADRLERSTVVVYARFGRSLGGAPARLAFMTAAAGDRYLLVTIDRVGRSPNALIALLAHELQHAVEVAEAPDVSDEEALRQLFARVGRQHAGGFETAHAAQLARVVDGELAGRPRGGEARATAREPDV